MKWVFIVFLLFLLPLASARITDTVYTVPPNGLECLDLNIPEDFGVINARVQFVVTSTCGEWCDFVQSVITTDNTNPVILPICINADGRRIGDQSTFNIKIQGQGEEKKYTLNVCVADTADRDDNPGSGNPCVLASRRQDNFDIVINPNPIYISPGSSVQYSLSIYSQDTLDLEIESSTGKTWSVTTTPKKSIVLQDVVQDSVSSITVTGKIKNCPVDPSGNTISECIKKTIAPVYVTNQNAPGNFTISLTPLNANTNKDDTVSYSLEVNNLGDPKEFIVDVILPDGYVSDFSRTTKTITGKETLQFTVTPTVSSSFDVIVKSVDGEKSERPFISVEEILTDIQKSRDTGNNPPKINKCLNQHSVQNKDAGISDQVDSWGDFVDCANSPDTGVGGGSSTGEENGVKFDMLFIVIPIAVIILVLLFYFYKKKQPVDEKDEDW